MGASSLPVDNWMVKHPDTELLKEWGSNVLGGRPKIGNVRERPWGATCRFITDEGIYWGKTVSTNMGLVPDYKMLPQSLSKKYSCIPSFRAVDEKTGYMLYDDHGRTLYLEPSLAHWREILTSYAKVQPFLPSKEARNLTQEFALSTLPENLALQGAFKILEKTSGHNSEKDYMEQVEKAYVSLEKENIPFFPVHNDIHANNVTVENIIIDWSDVWLLPAHSVLSVPRQHIKEKFGKLPSDSLVNYFLLEISAATGIPTSRFYRTLSSAHLLAILAKIASFAAFAEKCEEIFTLCEQLIAVWLGKMLVTHKR